MEQWVEQNLMNAESERVDADQCAGEIKMAAGVVKLWMSWLVTNAEIWVMAGMDYNMVY